MSACHWSTDAGTDAVSGPSSAAATASALTSPRRDEHEPPGVEDRAEALGQAVGRHVVDVVEEPRVVAAGAVRQPLDPRARGERRPGLVEAEVAVRADAEHLHVDTPERPDPLLVRRGRGHERREVATRPVGYREPLRRQPDDVAHLAQEHLAVALGVARRQPDVFVEGDAVGPAEVGLTPRDGLAELAVQPDRRRPGGQPQHRLAPRPAREPLEHRGSRPPGGRLGRRADDDLHQTTAPTGSLVPGSRAAPIAATGTSPSSTRMRETRSSRRRNGESPPAR